MPDDHLYGKKEAPKVRHISSATSLSFSSNLEALLASSNTSRTPIAGRTRPKKDKDDIFKTHNKGSKKRAARDEQEPEQDGSRSRPKFGPDMEMDDAERHRARRKMEDKARLYNAMKRGDYVPSAQDDERGRALVDFDRKWAESQKVGGAVPSDESSEEDLEDGEDGGLVEYIDELGRTRMGTRAAAARSERARNAGAEAAREPDRFSARPAMPESLIYGDAVQSLAFNPDAVTERAMETLAKKRDRSLTPPEQKHYDAAGEIRTRGVGFYAFSKDEELRKSELANLEAETRATEKAKKELAERKRQREQELEDRRRRIRELRGEKQADQFLNMLGESLGEAEPPPGPSSPSATSDRVKDNPIATPQHGARQLSAAAKLASEDAK